MYFQFYTLKIVQHVTSYYKAHKQFADLSAGKQQIEIHCITPALFLFVAVRNIQTSAVCPQSLKFVSDLLNSKNISERFASAVQNFFFLLRPSQSCKQIKRSSRMPARSLLNPSHCRLHQRAATPEYRKNSGQQLCGKKGGAPAHCFDLERDQDFYKLKFCTFTSENNFFFRPIAF